MILIGYPIAQKQNWIWSCLSKWNSHQLFNLPAIAAITAFDRLLLACKGYSDVSELHSENRVK